MPIQTHKIASGVNAGVQGNLGGSGGYSRIMYEALENTESPFILYMDDDIAIEPDSVPSTRDSWLMVGPYRDSSAFHSSSRFQSST